jgi:hypothetical protein
MIEMMGTLEWMRSNRMPENIEELNSKSMRTNGKPSKQWNDGSMIEKDRTE